MAEQGNAAEPTRVVTYSRVSTQEQGDSGAGLEAQAAKVAHEIAARGWVVVEQCTDVASGKSLKKRPELARALTTLSAGHADLLVVAKLDRLSRSMLDFAGIVALSQDEGWGIVALDIGVDTSTPNGKLVANIIMAMAEWERELIGARTRDALQAVRARGTQLGRRSNVPDDVLAMIRALKGQGVSYGAISRTLNKAGVPTAQGGKAWYPATVKKIFENDADRADGDDQVLV